MAGQLIKRSDRVWVVRVFAGRDHNGKRSCLNRTVHGTEKDADAVMRDMLLQKDRGGLAPRAVGPVFFDSSVEFYINDPSYTSF